MGVHSCPLGHCSLRSQRRISWEHSIKWRCMIGLVSWENIMPKKKTVSQHLGNGRGAFHKALLSVLLEKHSEQDALDVAIKEFGKRCVYCGDNNAFLQTDLLWPAYLGGATVAGNVVPACPSCNSERGAKNWNEYISTSKRVTSKKSTDEIEKQIEEIKNYMRKYTSVKSSVICRNVFF